MNNTTNVFKDRGTQYVEDFSDSEDAWEHALSCDPRIIAALHGLSADERAEAADEFGEGFMEAAYPTPSYKLIDPHNEAGWQETSRQEDGKMLYANGVQVEVDLKNPPLLEGGIPAPRTWCQVLTDDTNGGRGYDVEYTPFSSLGWIFNAANVRRAVIFGTYATRGEAWLAAEAFNASEAARQRHLQG